MKFYYVLMPLSLGEQFVKLDLSLHLLTSTKLLKRLFLYDFSCIYLFGFSAHKLIAFSKATFTEKLPPVVHSLPYCYLTLLIPLKLSTEILYLPFEHESLNDRHDLISQLKLMSLLL